MSEKTMAFLKGGGAAKNAELAKPSPVRTGSGNLIMHIERKRAVRQNKVITTK